MGRVAETDSINRENILPLLIAALKEDVGSRDMTSAALIPTGQSAKAEIVIRKEGVIAGLQVAEWVFEMVNPKVKFQPMVKDGQKAYPAKAVAFLEGPARGILAGERVALNFLAHLSGIATFTRAFVDRVKGTPVKIMDTRKTTPGLRLLEKYAVRMGGGVNHRMGLYDSVLIKDNHLRLAGGVEKAVAQVRSVVQKGIPVQLEVANLQEFRQALSARPDLILLDNMRLSEMQEAVRLRNAVARSNPEAKIPLEVSGGVTLETARQIALTGVERISIGALTHSAPILNVALEVVG